MESVSLKFSKSKVDKAGDLLKNPETREELIDSSLQILSNWRAYHASALGSFAKVLKTRSQKINDTTIVAQRLKRTPSILLKLSNHKTMRLSAMQDIGGVRAILPSVDDVYRLLEIYKNARSKHSLFTMDDYIHSPKSDGYRSIHLVYKLKKAPSIFLELQFRSQLQHIWATGVEVFGTLKNSSFKTGQGNKEWLDFFALLSSIFAIKEKCPVIQKHKDLTPDDLIKKLQKLSQKLMVLENLSLYTSVYKTIKNSIPRGRKGRYQLITLNSREKTISYKTFGNAQFENAEKLYFELEQKHLRDEQINVVLVNTEDIQKLEASYPNYFMDTKALIQKISLIMMNKFL